MASPEEKPFLDPSASPTNASDLDDFHASTFQSDGRRQKSIPPRRIWLGHVALLAVYTVSFLALGFSTQRQARTNDPLMPYSPANEAVRFESRVPYSYDEANPFAGEPRLELDMAWHKLMRGVAIRVSESELQKANMSSIPLRNGGYVASLGVYHELHCVKRIKQFLHPGFYYANSTNDEWLHAEHHLDHCLEVLRQGILCRADFSLYTFQWKTPYDEKPQTIADGRQKCVDWRTLEYWALSREVDPVKEVIRLREET